VAQTHTRQRASGKDSRARLVYRSTPPTPTLTDARWKGTVGHVENAPGQGYSVGRGNAFSQRKKRRDRDELFLWAKNHGCPGSEHLFVDDHGHVCPNDDDE
jgi:hypothetical protein